MAVFKIAQFLVGFVHLTNWGGLFLKKTKEKNVTVHQKKWIVRTESGQFLKFQWTMFNTVQLPVFAMSVHGGPASADADVDPHMEIWLSQPMKNLANFRCQSVGCAPHSCSVAKNQPRRYVEIPCENVSFGASAEIFL